MAATSPQQFYQDRLAEYDTLLAAAEEEARAAQAKIAFLKERIVAVNTLLDELNVDGSDEEA
jgi:hypothetical protein